MTDRNKSEEIDWSVCTWKGSRRLQHQEFHALPFARKLEIVEEMGSLSRRTTELRRKRGLPYIDPYTKERVPGKRIRRA